MREKPRKKFGVHIQQVSLPVVSGWGEGQYILAAT